MFRQEFQPILIGAGEVLEAKAVFATLEAIPADDAAGIFGAVIFGAPADACRRLPGGQSDSRTSRRIRPAFCGPGKLWSIRRLVHFVGVLSPADRLALSF